MREAKPFVVKMADVEVGVSIIDEDRLSVEVRNDDSDVEFTN